MIPLHRRGSVLAGLALLIGLAGCGVQAKAKKGNDLKELGLMYHRYFAEKLKAPDKASDLEALAETPAGKAALKQTEPGGAYVFVWGVNLNDVAKTPAGTGGTILGYESAAPTAGGMVLLVDGSVRQMSADEFNAAARARPSVSK